MGLLIFHEQAMRVWHRVFGVSLGDADNRRRWQGRYPRERPQDEAQLVAAARDRGVWEEAATQILDALISAPHSTFPEAHCRTYSRLTYWHAYLKTRHAAELAVACSRVGHDGVAALEPTSGSDLVRDP